MNRLPDQAGGYAGRAVVVDTGSAWLYIGRLVSADERYVVLENADAADLSEITLTKHDYLMRVKTDGIVPNRRRVMILTDKVVALTLLEDVEEE